MKSSRYSIFGHKVNFYNNSILKSNRYSIFGHKAKVDLDSLRVVCRYRASKHLYFLKRKVDLKRYKNAFFLLMPTGPVFYISFATHSRPYQMVNSNPPTHPPTKYILNYCVLHFPWTLRFVTIVGFCCSELTVIKYRLKSFGSYYVYWFVASRLWPNKSVFLNKINSRLQIFHVMFQVLTTKPFLVQKILLKTHRIFRIWLTCFYSFQIISISLHRPKNLEQINLEHRR